jgi:hypothetical protein
VDGFPAQGEGGGVKKQAPPKKTKAELTKEARILLRLNYSHPDEAVDFLLAYFHGWDLEEIIRHLRMPWQKMDK